MRTRNYKTELYLLAHAQAQKTSGASSQRTPLSEKGKHQASALRDLLYPYKIGVFLSSPEEFCLDTVRPSADKYGIGVRVVGQMHEQQEKIYEEISLLCREHRGAIVCLTCPSQAIGLFLNAVDERFTLEQGRQIRDLQLFHVTFDGASQSFVWDEAFVPTEGFDGLTSSVTDLSGNAGVRTTARA